MRRILLFTLTLLATILSSFIMSLTPVAVAVNIPVGGVVHAVCGGDIPCFTLTGPDFSLVAGQSSQVTGNEARFPGQDTTLNARPIVDQFATLTFQGINYLPGGAPFPFGSAFGVLPVSTPAVRFPENPPPRVQLTSPAVLSTSLVGQNPVTNQFLTFDLSGFGSATGVFVVCQQCSPQGLYVMETIDYELIAIPEASTWLLIGSGLVLLLLLKRSFAVIA